MSGIDEINNYGIRKSNRPLNRKNYISGVAKNILSEWRKSCEKTVSHTFSGKILKNPGKIPENPENKKKWT